jgi:hypothetical protein
MRMRLAPLSGAFRPPILPTHSGPPDFSALADRPLCKDFPRHKGLSLESTGILPVPLRAILQADQNVTEIEDLRLPAADTETRVRNSLKRAFSGHACAKMDGPRLIPDPAGRGSAEATPLAANPSVVPIPEGTTAQKLNLGFKNVVLFSRTSECPRSGFKG